MKKQFYLGEPILIVEGKRIDTPSFAAALQKKGFDVHLAPNGSAAVAKLDRVNPTLVVVNAPSLRTNGKRICASLRAKNPKYPIILITDEDLSDARNPVDAVLQLPFTVQKLVNRIRTLLPTDGKNIVHVGPIRLDTDRRRVRCLGRSVKLTPRLVALLHALMDEHGKTVEREALFRKVWETNYTGDMRTLDTHVSWLRRAIELDPLKPKFLKTARGVGYRLEI